MTSPLSTAGRASGPAPGRRRPSRRAVLALGGLGALGLGGLAAWAYMPGGYLTFDARLFRALKTDPMAAVPLLGREPVLVMDQEPPGLASVEHVSPDLKRFFRDDAIGQQALVQELVTYAQQVGWSHNPAESWEGRWSGTRPHKDFTVLSLSIYPLDSLEPEAALYECVAVIISQG